MKLFNSQFSSVFSEGERRRNLLTLLRYLAFLFVIILTYALIFQLIMVGVEDQSHSWITGIYWTLVTMTTLGFGDITFTSDIGRLFSVFVLLSGVVLLLVVLPFTFIRFFYAPWLESQVRLRAPRQLRPSVREHVIISRHDEIAAGLIERLRPEAIPYCVIEPDPAVAAQMLSQGISVITGDIDNRSTYEGVNVQQARLVLANREDTTNTNLTLTVREVTTDVPVVAFVEDQDSIDILELSGATHVLALKQRLGEHLANRVSAGHGHADVIGVFKGLQIAEFPAHNTPLAGRNVRETRMRETMGLNIVGVWQRGRLRPAFPDTQIADQSVVVVVGVPEQIGTLNDLLQRPHVRDEPVLVIGGGKVGRAATRALKRKGVLVHVLERDDRAHDRLAGICDQHFVGDAADREALMRAGLENAPSVLLTTNDDAMNVYLAVYCRRLKPDLRIVSRIRHERNLEAIHRAGADFVLSYSTLGVDAVFSVLQGHELVILGEGVDLFTVDLPPSLQGKTLAETGIGSRTGLSVVAVGQNAQLVTTLQSSMRLEPGAELIMLGSVKQRQEFADVFG